MFSILKNKSQGFEISDGYNMLMLRAEEGNLEEVVSILNNARQQPDINAINKRGYTALAVAVKAGAYEVAKILISRGADPNIKNNSGQSPLFLSCWCNFQAIVELLLESGAEINTLDQRGWSPLIIAAYNGHIEIVKLLLQYRADPTLKDSFGKRAIERTRDAKIIKILENAENKPTTSILKRPSLKNGNSSSTSDLHSSLKKQETTPQQQKRGALSLALNTSPTNLKSPKTPKVVSWHSPSNKGASSSRRTHRGNVSFDQGDVQARSPLNRGGTPTQMNTLPDKLTTPSQPKSRTPRGLKSPQAQTQKVKNLDLGRALFSEADKEDLKKELDDYTSVQVQQLSQQIQSLIEQKVSQEVIEQIQEYHAKLKEGLESLVYTKIMQSYRDLQMSFNNHLKSLLGKFGYDQSATSLAQLLADEESFAPKEVKLNGATVKLLNDNEIKTMEVNIQKTERALLSPKFDSSAAASSQDHQIKSWRQTDAKSHNSVNRMMSPYHSNRVQRKKALEKVNKGIKGAMGPLVDYSKRKIDEAIQNEAKTLQSNIFGELNTNINYLEEEAKKKFEVILANKFAQLSEIMANGSLLSEDITDKTGTDDSFNDRRSSSETKSVMHNSSKFAREADTIKEDNRNGTYEIFISDNYTPGVTATSKFDKSIKTTESIKANQQQLKDRTDLTRESLESVAEVEESAKEQHTTSDLRNDSLPDEGISSSALNVSLLPVPSNPSNLSNGNQKGSKNNMAKLNITHSSIPLQTGGSLEVLSSEYRLDGLKNFYEKKSLNEIDKKQPSSRNSITKDLLPLSANRQQNASPFIPGHSLSGPATGMPKYEFSND